MNPADPPRILDLSHLLEESLTDVLGYRLNVSLLSHLNTVADGTIVFMLRDALGRRRAVALCSAPAAPDMVLRAMKRAREAKAILGAPLGAAILDSLAEGRVGGMSYAVLPYCNDLSKYRVIWWPQRALLRPFILDWLWHLTECTMRDVGPAAIDHGFAEPLRHIASLERLSDKLRAAAGRATTRVDNGAWVPKQVLMHGDLWKGNILIQPASRSGERRKWHERFAIIDWAGSEIHGHAIYDLIRLAQSMGLRARGLRREVNRHCRLLGCDPIDAKSYLLAALGYVHMNLEYFPFDRFARMAEDSLTILEHALTS